MIYFLVNVAQLCTIVPAQLRNVMTCEINLQLSLNPRTKLLRFDKNGALFLMSYTHKFFHVVMLSKYQIISAVDYFTMAAIAELNDLKIGARGFHLLVSFEWVQWLWKGTWMVV